MDGSEWKNERVVRFFLLSLDSMRIWQFQINLLNHCRTSNDSSNPSEPSPSDSAVYRLNEMKGEGGGRGAGVGESLFDFTRSDPPRSPSSIYLGTWPLCLNLSRWWWSFHLPRSPFSCTEATAGSTI